METKSTYSKKLLDPRWQRKRTEILQRDNFTCVNCGNDKETLHVHHLKYYKNPWDVSNDFLETLCESCHRNEHFKDEKVIEDVFIDFANIRYYPGNVDYPPIQMYNEIFHKEVLYARSEDGYIMDINIKRKLSMDNLYFVLSEYIKYEDMDEKDWEYYGRGLCTYESWKNNVLDRLNNTCMKHNVLLKYKQMTFGIGFKSFIKNYQYF